MTPSSTPQAHPRRLPAVRGVWALRSAAVVVELRQTQDGPWTARGALEIRARGCESTVHLEALAESPREAWARLAEQLDARLRGLP